MRDRIITFFIIFLVLMLLSGCSEPLQFIPKEGIWVHQSNGVSYHVQTYTAELDVKYKYGSDFIYPPVSDAFNHAFLLTIENKSKGIVDILPQMAAVLIDSRGTQYKVNPQPNLPSVDKASSNYKFSLANSFPLKTPLEEIEDELKYIYERENYLRKQMATAHVMKEDIVTRDIQNVLSNLERELLALDRRTLELKREKILGEKRQEVALRALFPGGVIYPGASIIGLLVFNYAPEQNGSQSITVKFREPTTGEILSFPFALVKR